MFDFFAFDSFILSEFIGIITIKTKTLLSIYTITKPDDFLLAPVSRWHSKRLKWPEYSARWKLKKEKEILIIYYITVVIVIITINNNCKNTARHYISKYLANIFSILYLYSVYHWSLRSMGFLFRFVCVHTHTHPHRERERDTDTHTHTKTNLQISRVIVRPFSQWPLFIYYMIIIQYYRIHRWCMTNTDGIKCT